MLSSVQRGFLVSMFLRVFVEKDVPKDDANIATLVNNLVAGGFSNVAILESDGAVASVSLLSLDDASRMGEVMSSLGFSFSSMIKQPLTIDGKNILLLKCEVKHPDISAMMDVNALPLVEDLVSRLLSGIAKVDNLTPVVYMSKISERDVDIFRMYGAYLHQIKFVQFQNFIDAISREYSILGVLKSLFYAKFDPRMSLGSDTSVIKTVEHLDFLIGNCQNPSAKTALIRLLSVLNASVRTNFFCNNGSKDYISIKLKSGDLNIAKPSLFAEIFVYHRDFQAIHLRGGKVARGGLRWSDRSDDFRTEVFGLVKTQILKNALIVPTGSKGGFVILANDNSKKFAIDCYKKFIRGLLDITDNVVGGKVVTPEEVIIFDEKDPYLVVAADKGTASFSDYANEVSAEYDFWLGDAFASGGSNGYSHKEIGITARGAWESVKYHFKSLNIDPMNNEFTAIGIGSMNGDVFGNGMIYSDKIKLLAAFSHAHIFLDPNPDAAKSFKERVRLFKLQGSSWEDYDKSFLSSGGMIISRSEDKVTPSLEVRKMLNIPGDIEFVQANEIIRKVLMMKVDLLWSGGIGTFVKGSTEADSDVKDSANDAIRVNGKDVGARVIGEGGNLCFTDAGRVEYSLAGGRCFADAIDNVAGVHCSDREVNIKIILHKALKNRVIDMDKFKFFMNEMKSEVVEKILHDSYIQSICIGRLFDATLQSKMYKFAHMIGVFKNDSLIGSYMSSMPNEDSFSARSESGAGLTMPEIATLVSCNKIYLFNEFLKIGNEFFKHNIFDHVIEGYFPSLMLEEFDSYVLSHELRAEIVSTVLANEMVNYFGFTFFQEICMSGGLSTSEFLLSYTFMRKLFGVSKILHSFEKYDSTIGLKLFYEGLSFISDSLKIGTIMFAGLARSPGFEGMDVFMVQFMQSVTSSEFLNKIDKEMFEHDFGFAKMISDPDLTKGLELLFAIEDFIACLFVVKKVRSTDFARFFQLYKSTKEILNLPNIKRFVKDGYFTTISDSLDLLRVAKSVLENVNKICLRMVDFYMKDGALEQRCKEVMESVKFSLDDYKGLPLDGDRVKVVMNDFLNHSRVISSML